MRQQQTSSLSCLTKKFMRISECYEVADNWLKPEVHNFWKTDEKLVNVQGAKTQYLLSRTSRRDIRFQLRQLEDEGWMSRRSTMVEMLFTTYNAHVDVFVACFIRLYVNRAGHIHKVIEPVAHWVNPFHSSWSCWVADITWVLITLKLVSSDVAELVKHWRELGLIHGTKVYSSVGNVLNWFSVSYSVVIVVMFGLYLGQISQLRDYLERADLQIPGSFTNRDDMEGFYSLAEDMSYKLFVLRSVLMGYPFVIGMRLFRSFDAQPRLALVTRTLQKASMEIIHFAVVFCSVFAIYTAAAMVMFGPQMASYSSISRATTSVFVILLGDFDWDDMSGIGLPHAMIWFTSFCVLVQLIMLNMLLAIVMDVYTEVKTSLGPDAPTIFSQVRTIFRRYRERRQGLRVSLQTILKAIDPEELDTRASLERTRDMTFTPESIMEAVPGLRVTQAKRILESAIDDWTNSDKEPTATTDTNVRMLNLIGDVGEVKANLDDQFDLQCRSASLTASTTRDILKLLESSKSPDSVEQAGGISPSK